MASQAASRSISVSPRGDGLVVYGHGYDVILELNGAQVFDIEVAMIEPYATFGRGRWGLDWPTRLASKDGRLLKMIERHGGDVARLKAHLA